MGSNGAEDWTEDDFEAGAGNGGQVKVDDEDPYKDLMSDVNKATLKKIQLRQLSRDHPHSSDFYNSTIKIRKAFAEKDQEGAMKMLKKLYPLYRFGDGEDEGEDKGPMEDLTNTLGAIRISRANRPKFVLDTNVQDCLKRCPEEEDLQMNVISPRSVRLTVEKLYEYLLEYDEAVTRTDVLGYRSSYDSEVRDSCLQRAKALLSDLHVLTAVTSIDKGRVAVSRLLLILEPSFGCTVLANSIFQLSSTESSGKNSEIYRGIYHCLKHAQQPDLEILLANLESEKIKRLGNLELGITYLLDLLHYFKKSVSKNSDHEVPSLWIQLVNHLTEALAGLENMSVPIKIPKGLRHQIINDPHIYDEYRNFWDLLLDSLVEAGLKE